MNIHLASLEADLKSSYGKVYKNFLITFEHFARAKSPEGRTKMVNTLLKYYPGGEHIILDSGAFSKANGVVHFELSDYIDFLHTHKDVFWAYITLDVPLGNTNDLEKIKESFRETQENLKTLESEGLTPIPVYQRKWDRLDVLEEYLKKYEYICIGGTIFHSRLSGEDKPSIRKFLDKVFELNSKYKKKIHGLGQTTPEILLAYPFYSVDSTSWKMTTSMGGVYNLNGLDWKTVFLDKSAYEKFCYEYNLYDQNKKSYWYNRNLKTLNFLVIIKEY